MTEPVSLILSNEHPEYNLQRTPASRKHAAQPSLPAQRCNAAPEWPLDQAGSCPRAWPLLPWCAGMWFQLVAADCPPQPPHAKGYQPWELAKAICPL